MAREYTNKVMEMVEEGLVDKDVLIRDLLCWMSEADVEQFHVTYFADEDSDEDSEEEVEDFLQVLEEDGFMSVDE